MTPCSPSGIINSDMATSNYKKSKNYDTCVYVGEETDTIQS